LVSGASSEYVQLIGPDDWAWRDRGPTQRAITQFGMNTADLRRLAGGAGMTWTDGRVVVKPVGYVPEHDWVCSVYAGWASDEVRVPQPVRPRASDDSWSVDGWGAHVFVPGRNAHPETELDVIAEASGRFHAAVALLPRPAFIDSREDPWAFGDRLAWEAAEPLGDSSTLEVIDRFLCARCSTDSDRPASSRYIVGSWGHWSIMFGAYVRWSTPSSR
jgi:hypothetical protein